MANLETRILSNSTDHVISSKDEADTLTSHPALNGLKHYLSNPDLAEAAKLTYFDLSDLLIAAMEEGNFYAAKNLLENKELKFSEEAKARAMKLAAEQNQLDLLELLVEKSVGEIYGFSIMLELINFAVEKGRLALLHSLLDRGLPKVKSFLDKVGPNLYRTLFESFIGETYVGAAEAGQKDIVEYLHKKIGSFPPATMGAAFRAAGLHNHLAIVEFHLINALDKLPEEEINWLFDFAIKHNSRQPLLKSILTYASEKVAVKKIEHGFLYAIRHLFHAISECIYEFAGSRISANGKVAACKAAALSGHVPTVQMLLAEAPREGLKWLLNFSTEKTENLPFLKILLKEVGNKFTDAELDRLFARAVQSHQLPIAECLFDKVGARLKGDTLKNALKISATQEDLAMSRFLLAQASDRFTWWDKVAAVWSGFQAQPRAFFSLVNLFFLQSEQMAESDAMLVSDSQSTAAIEIDDLLLGKAFTPGLRQYMTSLAAQEAPAEVGAAPELRSKMVLQ